MAKCVVEKCFCYEQTVLNCSDTKVCDGDFMNASRVKYYISKPLVLIDRFLGGQNSRRGKACLEGLAGLTFLRCLKHCDGCFIKVILILNAPKFQPYEPATSISFS